MIIFIKHDKTYNIEIEKNSTVRHLLLTFLYKMNGCWGWLEYIGKQLELDKTIEFYNICQFATITYHMKYEDPLWFGNFILDKKIMTSDEIINKYNKEMYLELHNEVKPSDTIELLTTNMLEMYSTEFDNDITKKICHLFEKSLKYPFGKNSCANYMKELINSNLDKKIIMEKMEVFDSFLDKPQLDKSTLKDSDFGDLEEETTYKTIIQKCFHSPEPLDILDTFMIHLYYDDEVYNSFGTTEIRSLIECGKLTCEGKEYFTSQLELENIYNDNYSENEYDSEFKNNHNFENNVGMNDNVETDSEYESDYESDYDSGDDEFEEKPKNENKNKNLPKHHITEFFDLYKMANKTIECAICYSEIEKAEELVITNCGHKFCTDCFTHIDNKCPVCRQLL